jgi:PAS domain S-box-containing protein
MERKIQNYLKIIIIPFVLVVIVLPSLLYYIYIDAISLVKEQFNEQQMLLAKQTAVGIEGNMEILVRELNLLSKKPAVRLMNLKDARKYMGETFECVEPLKANDIALLDSKGIARINLFSPQLEGTGFSYRKYFKQARMLKKSSPAYEFITFKGVEVGKKGIIIAVPIFSSDKKFNGVVLLTVKVDELIEGFRPSKSGKGQFWVVDFEGNVLYHPKYKPGTILKKMPDLDISFKTFLEKIKSDNPYKADCILPDGVKVTAVSFPIRIGEQTWSIVIATPEKEVSKLLISFSWKHACVSLIVTLLILGISFASIHTINKRNFGLQLEISKRRHEEKIFQRIQSRLELKVKARTSELRKFKFISDYSNEGQYLVNEKGRFLYVNEAACKMMGYSRDELLKLSVPDVDTLYDKAKYQELFKLIQKEKVPPFETINKRKDGTTYPVDISVTVVEVDSRPHLFAVTRDITERKEAVRSLKESEKKYRTLVETANDAIFLADAETGVILEANKKAEELIGIPAKKIVGMHQAQLHPPEDAEFYKNLFINHVFRGQASPDTCFVIHKDGHKIPVQIGASIIESEGKKLIIGIFRDITIFKEIEKNLKEDKDSLEKVVEEKTKEFIRLAKKLEDAKRLSDIGALAATVAHELRNPLGVIRTAIYNIRKKTKEPSLDSHLNNIDKKIAESDQIIKNLLSYSRIQIPQYEKVKVLDILDECLKHCKEKYSKWEVKIEIKDNSKKFNVIEADPIHISELFSNILDNAYQAFPDEKGTITVTADYNNQEDKFYINFQDNGIGIKDNDLKKIFDPFFTSKAKGIGLGLTVCSQVVYLHKGTIDIESSKGKGTTVRVGLPINRADA